MEAAVAVPLFGGGVGGWVGRDELKGPIGRYS